MSDLQTQAVVGLQNYSSYLDKIVDRLKSFQAEPVLHDDNIVFDFPFGKGRFLMEPGRLVMKVQAADPDGLARIKDLLATAVQVYGREDSPQIVWEGDLAGETQLPQFREMTVVGSHFLTPTMKRIRLAGNNLERFAKYGNMHIRMLFPTARVPKPEWPSLGVNGLAVWPPEDRKPTARAYTVRSLNVEEGWMEVDFLMHSGESVGAAWAETATEGQKIGIMGPVGRPVPMDAQWYVMGCDQTALPAVARMLETLPPRTCGYVFIEAENETEFQELNNSTQIQVNWIYRNGKPAGFDPRLADLVLAVDWPDHLNCFGWFAAEGNAANRVRKVWREDRGLGREQTLTATYWKQGQSGFMTG